MIDADETFDGTWPFQPHFSNTTGFRQHYVDEGPRDAEVVICIHGEPTWGYLYRNFIPSLSKNYRVIVPDHMGFGKSETPQDRVYTLQTHVENLSGLIDDLNLMNITFVCQDWGGPMTGAYTIRNPDRVKRVALMNTLFAYGGEAPNPERSNWFKWIAKHHQDGTLNGILGELGSTILSVMKILGFQNSAAVNETWIRAYSAPFPDRASCIGGIEFPLDVHLQRAFPYIIEGLETGNLEAVEALLLKGADSNKRESNNQTALMWAAAEGHLTVVDALIEAGADIHAAVNSGFTPLLFAVREGHIDVTHTLLTAGIDVNQILQRVPDGPDRPVNNASYRPVDEGMSPLLLAVRNGHFELAVELIKAGADPNDQRTGFTPLHTMSWVRKPDASDRGDPSPIGSGRLTALQFVRSLVALGADVNLRLSRSTRAPHTASRLQTEGATAFLMAADRADEALMQLLLDLGADPFIPNTERSTPLMAAAGLGTSAPEEEAGTEAEAAIATQLLLDLGADIDSVDDNGDTAMHGAAYGNFPMIVHILAANGADSNIWKETNKLGRTPLFIAEGHRGGLPRLSRPTIDAVESLMLAEGLPTDGQRPEIVDQYSRPATQQQ